MGAPRFITREGAANRIHREHPQAMRSQRFVPPTYTMDARYDYGWPEELQPQDAFRQRRRNVVVVIGAAVALWLAIVVLALHGLGWLPW